MLFSSVWGCLCCQVGEPHFVWHRDEMFAFDYIPLRFQIKFKKKKKKLTLNMPQPTSSSPLLASFEVPLSYAYISLALNVTSNIVVYQSKSFYFLSDFFFFTTQTNSHLWKFWTHVYVWTGACTALHAALSQWRACHLEAPGYVSGVDSCHQSACSASCPSCRYTMQKQSRALTFGLKGLLTLSTEEEANNRLSFAVDVT